MLRSIWQYILDTDWHFRLFKKKQIKLKITGQCQQTGNCCRNLVLMHKGRPVKELKTFQKMAKKWPYYNYFVPHSKEYRDGCLRFSCSKLNADNTCSIYKTRPLLCRKYPDQSIFYSGGTLLPGCGYKVEPRESFEELLDINVKKKEK